MSTKFVVLWLRTVDNPTSADERDLITDVDNFPSLEEAWQKYNKLITNDFVQQVMILVPLKDFNRSTNKT